MKSHEIEFSIVILTYNREKYIKKYISEISKLSNSEVIIVDNNSETDYAQQISQEFENVRCIRLEKNYGAVGRNFGIKESKGNFIITLDDDVWGITQDKLNEIKLKFEEDDEISAICFKVIDEESGEITNWSHHSDPDIFSDKTFDTYEISEGAVAFRRKIFEEVGLYPIEFFISHEGPDLAFRILNSNHRIIYFPGVDVVHAHAVEGRANWRRYYYDTRNSIWLAYRNYDFQMMLLKLPLHLGAMLIYSLRDGFLKYYFKGIYDAIRGVRQFRGTRNPVTSSTRSRMKEIDKDKPPISYYIKRRLIRRGVRI